jgi:hypothetical protein
MLFKFCRITLRNMSNYGLQLKYNSGNMALAPGALSDIMICQSIVMGRAYVSSLELKKLLIVMERWFSFLQPFSDRLTLPTDF